MVILSFAVSMTIIFYMVSKKINIGAALTLGASILLLLNGSSISSIITLIASSITNSITINLALAISLITILGYLMEYYKIISRMISALRNVLRSTKVTILLAPALMGMLQISGGALMSCPIVNNLGDELKLDNVKKAAINLLFRHGIYFVFPLSPAFILVTKLAEIEMWDFMKIQFPIFLMLYLVAYLILLRKVPTPVLKKISIKEYIKSLLSFLYFASPILLSLISAVFFDLKLYIAILLGLVVALIIHFIDTKMDQSFITEDNILIASKKGFKLEIVLAIVGIMIFKDAVNNIDGLLELFAFLVNSGTPVGIIIVIGTAILSFPLASVQPSIAILFPLIIPLAGDYSARLVYAMFIYSSGFIFYYISPLHMCQVLTLEYFDVNIKQLYKTYRLILALTFLTILFIYLQA
ncbi:MAG: DUF401 family protein [Clostridiales bacterium]|nr:DUF401 family protein [Clostridiales bacterium]